MVNVSNLREDVYFYTLLLNINGMSVLHSSISSSLDDAYLRSLQYVLMKYPDINEGDCELKMWVREGIKKLFIESGLFSVEEKTHKEEHDDKKTQNKLIAYIIKRKDEELLKTMYRSNVFTKNEFEYIKNKIA